MTILLGVDEYQKFMGVGINGRTGEIDKREHVFRLPAGRTNDLVTIALYEAIELAARSRRVDIIIRKDGVDHRFEADWLKYLVPDTALPHSSIKDR